MTNWTWVPYETPIGNQVLLDELRSLGCDAEAAVREVMERRAVNETRANENRKIGNGLWELRVPFNGQAYRVIYAPVLGGRLVALTAFSKKTQRLEVTVRRRAQKRLLTWQKANL